MNTVRACNVEWCTDHATDPDNHLEIHARHWSTTCGWQVALYVRADGLEGPRIYVDQLGADDSMSPAVADSIATALVAASALGTSLECPR